MLLTEGADVGVLRALQKAAAAEGALIELVAHRIGGVVTSDGQLLPVHQRIDGGPSVLYDAVAIIASDEGIAELVNHPAAKDFVSDAHAHAKFIAYTAAARPLLEAAGVADQLDDGYLALDKRASAATFLERCRNVRHWARSVPAASPDGA